MTASPMSPLALLDLDSLVGEEERAIRDTVRTFVDERLQPEIAGWYEQGDTPVRDLARELGRLGLLGMHLTGYGCGGTSATAYGLACRDHRYVGTPPTGRRRTWAPK